MGHVDTDDPLVGSLPQERLKELPLAAAEIDHPTCPDLLQHSHDRTQALVVETDLLFDRGFLLRGGALDRVEVGLLVRDGRSLTY